MGNYALLAWMDMLWLCFPSKNKRFHRMVTYPVYLMPLLHISFTYFGTPQALTAPLKCQ